MSGGGGGFASGFMGIAGGVLQMAADSKEAKAKIRAYQTNADWLEEQAEHARQATRRELTIHGREVNEVFGAQVSSFGKGGLDLTGSPLLVLANTRMREFEEARAISEQGYMQVREASLKAQEQRDLAAYTRSAASLKKTATILNMATGSLSSFSGGKK